MGWQPLWWNVKNSWRVKGKGVCRYLVTTEVVKSLNFGARLPELEF